MLVTIFYHTKLNNVKFFDSGVILVLQLGLRFKHFIFYVDSEPFLTL